MTDQIPMPVTYEARESKRGRHRTYILDAEGKTLLYSTGSYTSEADALAVGDVAVNGNAKAWSKKYEVTVQKLRQEERNHADEIKNHVKNQAAQIRRLTRERKRRLSLTVATVVALAAATFLYFTA